MRFLVSLLLFLAALFNIVTSAGLEIEITSPVECTRKTKKGDNVDMHYRGTLASDGSEFDASYNRLNAVVFAWCKAEPNLGIRAGRRHFTPALAHNRLGSYTR